MSASFHSLFVTEAPSRSAAFSKAFLKFASAIMIPVMIVTLFAALQELPVVAYLYKGFPAGLALSAIVALFWMRTTPGKVEIAEERVRILSIWESYQESRNPWAYVIDMDEQDDGRLRVTVGLDTSTIVAAKWPNYASLKNALQEARLRWVNLSARDL